MPKRNKKPDSIVLFLIHIRLLKKLTQQQVANQCNSVSLRTLQRIEQGKSDMSISQYRQLCDCYGVTSLDVSLGEIRHRPTTAGDVAATARLLPKRVREAFVDLMVTVAEELQHKDGKE